MPVFSFLRNKIWQTVISIMVTIQVINMSVDSVHPAPSLEDFTINEIESCAEFVLEVVLGYENAIQETHDHNHASHKPSANHILFVDALEFPVLYNAFSNLVKISADLPDLNLKSGFLLQYYLPPKCV
jgi:hypothetical protein